MLAVLTVSAICLAAIGMQGKDYSVVDLEDGFVRLETKTYSIEVPKGWEIGKETPWGDRKVTPSNGGQLGAMTAPPSQQSWEELYQTALYFINREEKGKATPFEKVKTKRGYEAASFSVLDDEGFAKRRFVMVKHPEKGLLALSVKITDKKQEKELASYFKRMVDTAEFK